MKVVRVGNAQGFWGDSPGAAARLIAQQPDLDYLTMDYLAEVSLSILARISDTGYPKDFLAALRSLVPHWEKGAPFRLITNAGGLNPMGCAQAAAEIAKGKKIFVVTGDDVREHFKEKLITANAYFGAHGIVEALQKGADIVITGRTADPSLTVAPCIHHFGWSFSDYDEIAGATIAGHLIECGTQVTGGISTNWLDIPDPATIGFPVVEVYEDGSCLITKPPNTGGEVSLETVKEQLLYEIGDPDNYLSPDATVSFLSLALDLEGANRVRLTGAKGRPPPDTYKVSATYRNGYIAEAMLTLFGRHIAQKARRCGEIVLERVGYELEKFHVECLGGGDVVPGVIPETAEWELKECVLRLAAADPRREALECFAKEVAPLITSGPQGVTGYASGRPKVRELISFWPTTISTELAKPKVEEVAHDH